MLLPNLRGDISKHTTYIYAFICIYTCSCNETLSKREIQTLHVKSIKCCFRSANKRQQHTYLRNHVARTASTRKHMTSIAQQYTSQTMQHQYNSEARQTSKDATTSRCFDGVFTTHMLRSLHMRIQTNKQTYISGQAGK